MHTSDVTNTRAQTHTHKIHVTIRYTRHISFRCKGTLAYVHLSCLERWLNQSCRTYCELCRYYFNAVETPRYRWWALYLSGMNTSESAVSQAGCNSSTEMHFDLSRTPARFLFRFPPPHPLFSFPRWIVRSFFFLFPSAQFVFLLRADQVAVWS